MPNDAQRVVNLCEARWDANKSDCKAFVRAVSIDLGRAIPGGLDANGIVDYLRANAAYAKLADGTDAKNDADAGKFVVGGLKGADHTPPRAHGHVVVVVTGPLAQDSYPTAYWGSLGGVGKKNTTINYAWTAADRDKVEYFSIDLP